ncbi:hypothetical protein B4065_3828 [Caldibacillus thermoamylovorans]|nr:hypothetical protein B4065_3828 [Caldibacillus thermoamylovorans]
MVVPEIVLLPAIMNLLDGVKTSSGIIQTSKNAWLIPW